MIFETFDGKLAFAFHAPNMPDNEKRLRIYEVEDCGYTLRLGPQIGGTPMDGESAQ